MEKKAVVIVPHPDDMEILVNHSVQYLLKQGYKVHELCCSGGHYGTTIDKFKGKPLQKIRDIEVKEAARRYTINTQYHAVEVTHWNYIDGQLPFSQKSIARFRAFIENISPDLVIGPDPVFAIDYHPDHINSGKNVYFAIKNSHLRDKIHYFLFQTMRPNYYIPFQDAKLQTEVLKAHRSQLTPLQTKMIPKLSWLLYRIATPSRFNTSELLRKVDWKKEELQIKKLKQKIWYCLLQSAGQPPPEQFSPSPEALGLR